MVRSTIACEGARRFEKVHHGEEALVRVSVSCSLETGVRNSLHSSAKRGQRWRMCSCPASGLGEGHITAFTVPVLVGDVETMHGAQLGELPKEFGGPFELVEHFAGFGVGMYCDMHDKITQTPTQLSRGNEKNMM